MKNTYDTDYYFAIPLFFAGTLIIGAGIFIWIRRGISAHYKKRMRQRTDEYYTRALADKDDEIRRLTEKTAALQTIIHKYTRRIEALEGGVAAGEARMMQEEFQGELGRIKGKTPLPSTNVTAIDSMFRHFAKLFSAEGIKFHLKVNGSIPYMVENIIGTGKLATMTGDHLSDALIAINAGNNPFRGVMAVIGVREGCYEFAVFDSGIPFDVNTLARLGLEPVTTHADTGGSGIGFMTTFETMREYGASLIIDEQEPGGTDYAKSVTIRFDGRNRYIIKTYRPGELPACGRYEVVDNNAAFTRPADRF